jgi:homoserine kinase type II
MAVYTKINNSELRGFLSQYSLGELISFSEIAEGVENSNFLVQTTEGQFILTLYEKRVNPDDLPFFLGLLSHLSENNFVCPVPVGKKDGKVLNNLNGRPAAIVTFLEGASPKVITVAHCKALGVSMAKLHRAGNNFKIHRENSLSVKQWRPLLDSCDLLNKPIYIKLYNELNKEINWLETNWPKGLPMGIIHADLFPDNVFFLDDVLSGIIDFYFACTDFLAYDLATCINAWCFDSDETFNAEKSKALVDAYQTQRPLSSNEIAYFQVLARGSAIRFLLTRLYDWLNHPDDALVQPKDPMSYLKKLNFHQQVENPAQYGFIV